MWVDRVLRKSDPNRWCDRVLRKSAPVPLSHQIARGALTDTYYVPVSTASLSLAGDCPLLDSRLGLGVTPWR